MEAWSGCANECLRSHAVSGEILSSPHVRTSGTEDGPQPWEGSNVSCIC